MDAHSRTAAALAILLFASASAPSDWPAFRGAKGLGITTDTAVPLTWSPTENVLWKTKLPGNGTSSPIVWKDRVYVTCYTDYGLVGKGKGKGKSGDVSKLLRHLVCMDRKTGSILWQKEVATKLPESDFNGYIN